MRKLLVLGAGILQVPIIKKAKELGYITIVADGNPKAMGLEFADVPIVANIVDKELMLSVAKDQGVNGLIHPCSEVAMDVMGYINDCLGLSGISLEMARRATNKSLMRESFKRYGASSPDFFCTDNIRESWNYFLDLKTDAILKPSRNSGSRGISKVQKGISFEDFTNLFSLAIGNSRDKSAIIEQFIDGPEFSIEGVVFKNEISIIAITDKLTTGAPHFVELGHSQPSLYPSTIQNLISTTVLDGVKALGLNNCAIHAEVKVQNGVAYIMEIGARLGGDFITTDLTPLSTGVDIVAAAINIALGFKPNLKPAHSIKGSCIRYFTPKPGIIKSIEGLPDKKYEWIHQLELYNKIGDYVKEIKSSTDRSGHIITVGKDAREAIERAEKIIRDVHYKIV